MKKIQLIAVFMLIASMVFSQEENQEKKEPTVKFSGYINYEAYYDTYKSVTSREGDIYLYPVRQVLNSNNEDINAYGQLNMLSAQSRIRAKMSGTEAFGAKLGGFMELDFLGKAAVTSKGDGIDLTQTPRIRHMFASMDWAKTQLVFGQTWHPVFVTECFPDVLGFGAALPFNPLNRAPQIKVSHKLTENLQIVGAALAHLDFASSGPADAQKNAKMPDFHGQFKFGNSKINTGIVAGYKVLKPRTMIPTDSALTNKKIGSFDVAAFFKLKANKMTFKAYGIYGGNLTPYVMIGGYGAAEDPTTVDDYKYTNINTLAFWGEAIYQADALGFALFAGYTANLGTDETSYYNLKYVRGGDIDHLLRISPRVTYTSGKFRYGLEYMMTSATYFNMAAGKYEATATDDAVSNHRIYFTATYNF